MIRRAFLSSSVIQRQGKFDFKGSVKNLKKIDYKNEDFSQSVSSFDF